MSASHDLGRYWRSVSIGEGCNAEDVRAGGQDGVICCLCATIRDPECEYWGWFKRPFSSLALCSIVSGHSRKVRVSYSYDFEVSCRLSIP